MQITKPILVTGSHRSGTTWVGEIFRQSHQILYIPDSFHPNGTLRHRKVFTHWYQYITNENGHLYEDEFRRLFKLKFLLSEATSLRENPSNRLHYRNTPVRLRFYQDLTLLNLKRLFQQIPPITPLLKDPVALFSAPWIARNFHAQVIVLIRHPAAFYTSLRRVNWRFDFQNWRAQPLLIRDYLGDYTDKLSNDSLISPIEEACLLWNGIYSTVRQYQVSHPNWLYLRHEDLSTDPNNIIADMFTQLNLDFSPGVKRYITKTTSGNLSTPDPNRIHQLQRDSRTSATAWRHQLTENEIRSIRNLTEKVAAHFYDDTEW